MADTPEQRYERLKDTVQQTILQNFPNPERKGCPADAVVREVAERRDLIEDDAWQHITHCSPCYATFLQFKDEFRARRRRRGLGIIAGAIAFVALAGAFAIYEVRDGSEQASVESHDSYVAATLDLRDSSSQRGADTSPTAHPIPSLHRQKLDLTIDLPFGSEPGKYEIQLRQGGQALFTAEATAVWNRGNAELHVKLDLSKVAPGEYILAIRQPLLSWVENPIMLW
jgi:hypothetical protein